MKKLSFFILIFFTLLSFFVAINKVSADNTEKKKVVYFYQDACAHCQAVDEYFQKNEIYDKYDIKKIEISGVYNLNYFNDFFNAFGISPEKRGWPAIFFDNKFLVGDKPIQENFLAEIEKANADDFPSPETIQKYRLSAEPSLAGAVSSRSNGSLFILFGAALADSVSPCILAVFVILASIIIFGNPENKKEIFIFGSFFLLSIFLVYFTLGVSMFGSGKFFRLSEILSTSLGLAVIVLGLFVIRKYWKNLKTIERLKERASGIIASNLKHWLEKTWNFIKKNIQKMNLAIAALLIGFISSGFLFPCANKPYSTFANSFFGEREISKNILMFLLYNLIFIFPIVFLSGIIYWFAHTKKIEIFRLKHDKLIRIIVSIGLLFVGIYFIYNSCFLMQD